MARNCFWDRYRRHTDDTRISCWSIGHFIPVYPEVFANVKWAQILSGSSPRALSIQPKIPVISVATSNGTDHFGLVRPEYSGSALKVVHFDRSGHFGRSDRSVPFHLTKSLFLVPLFCILLARTITKCAVAWVGSVQPKCTVPSGTGNFRNFKPEFLLNGKRPHLNPKRQLVRYPNRETMGNNDKQWCVIVFCDQ